MKALIALALLALSSSVDAETLQGRWKLLAAEDLRADGSVGQYPWGKHPVGSIVVLDGTLYLQIMNSDVPAFPADKAAVGEEMKAAIQSTYISYTGPCVLNDTEGVVTFKVVAASRADNVGTDQKRFYRFENGKLLFGPAKDSIRAGTERLTRRLTLERVP